MPANTEKLENKYEVMKEQELIIEKQENSFLTNLLENII